MFPSLVISSTDEATSDKTSAESPTIRGLETRETLAIPGLSKLTVPIGRAAGCRNLRVSSPPVLDSMSQLEPLEMTRNRGELMRPPRAPSKTHHPRFKSRR